MQFTQDSIFLRVIAPSRDILFPRSHSHRPEYEDKSHAKPQSDALNAAEVPANNMAPPRALRLCEIYIFFSSPRG